MPNHRIAVIPDSSQKLSESTASAWSVLERRYGELLGATLGFVARNESRTMATAESMTIQAEKPDATQLAVDRTWLAHERTLMAWVRTSTSMISFGFTIYKFFQFEQGRNTPAMRGLLTPRDFALIIVGIGLVALFVATVQNRIEVAELRRHLGSGKRSLAILVAALVSMFGILVFISTILRA
jgi:putative membrane protein